jgi:hypothetical protein
MEESSTSCPALKAAMLSLGSIRIPLNHSMLLSIEWANKMMVKSKQSDSELAHWILLCMKHRYCSWIQQQSEIRQRSMLATETGQHPMTPAKGQSVIFLVSF